MKLHQNATMQLHLLGGSDLCNMKFPTVPDHIAACSASLLLSQYLRLSMAIFNLCQLPKRNCTDDPRRFSLGRPSTIFWETIQKHTVAQGRTSEETRKSQNGSPNCKWIWLSLVQECVFLLVSTISIANKSMAQRMMAGRDGNQWNQSRKSHQVSTYQFRYSAIDLVLHSRDRH